jgi:ATP-dependent DNA ligase
VRLVYYAFDLLHLDGQDIAGLPLIERKTLLEPLIANAPGVHPEGSRPHLGALLLGYYTDDGKLIYAGRVGTGMPDKVLADLRRRLDPLARPSSPLNVPPPRKTRFGSPLVLSRVHWVEPQLAEITYLTWTADELLRHTVYLGLRSDKPATEVRREVSLKR